MPKNSQNSRDSNPPVVTHIEGERLVRNKSTGQAYFNLPDERGRKKRFYQGHWDEPATLERAGRFIREYRAAGGPPGRGDGVSIRQLADRYLAFARDYYGETNQVRWIHRPALEFLCERYAEMPAAKFRPLQLITLRDGMVSSDRWTRSGVNQRLAILKAAFRWAVSRELVPASVWKALEAVENIARGRTKAREGRKVRSVEDEVLEATVAEMPPLIAAMVEVQRLTGTRPGELVIMRPVDIDRGGEVWVYRPSTHKTENYGHDRIAYIGPKAQTVLAPYLLGRAAEAYCFSPQEADAAHRSRAHKKRVTPLGQGNAPGTNRRRKPKVKPGDRYTTASYRRAIQRACDRAEVPRWAPNRLRHNRATELRAQFGLDAANTALGQSTGVTEVYAERNQKAAERIAAEIGYAAALRELYRPSALLRLQLMVVRISWVRRVLTFATRAFRRLSSPRDVETGDSVPFLMWFDYTDQGLMGRHLARGRPGISIDLDRECRLFWCTAFEWEDIDSHHEIVGNKIRNRHTGNAPACIHVPWESRFRAVFEGLYESIHGE